MTNVVYMTWEENGIPMSFLIRRVRSKDFGDLLKDLKDTILDNEMLLAKAKKSYESEYGGLYIRLIKVEGASFYNRHFLTWLNATLACIVEELETEHHAESMGFEFTIHPMIGSDEMSVRNMKAMYRLHKNMGEYARSYLHRMISLAEEILDNQICAEEHGTRHKVLFSYADFVNMMLNCTKEDAEIYSLEIRIRASKKAIACAVVHKGEPYYFEKEEMFGRVR